MKKKLFYKLFVILLSIILLSNLPLSESLACTQYDDWDCMHLLGGVGNWGNTPRYYYIDQTASYYTSKIQAAVTSWNNTNSPIYLIQTTVQDYSTFDVYYKPVASKYGEVLGATFTFYYQEAAYDTEAVTFNPFRNWTWVQIWLDRTNFYNISNSTIDQQQGTIAHEFGHAFGLSHTRDYYNIKAKIMVPLANGRTVNTPQVLDVEIVNHLYN